MTAFSAEMTLSFAPAVAGAHVIVDPLGDKPSANTTTFSRWCRVPLLKLAGVPYRRRYDIRHTRATEMLMKGVEQGFAAGQLGHAVAVFLGFYAKWIRGDCDAEEIEATPPALAANSSLVIPQT